MYNTSVVVLYRGLSFIVTLSIQAVYHRQTCCCLENRCPKCGSASDRRLRHPITHANGEGLRLVRIQWAHTQPIGDCASSAYLDWLTSRYVQLWSVNEVPPPSTSYLPSTRSGMLHTSTSDSKTSSLNVSEATTHASPNSFFLGSFRSVLRV